MHLILFSRNRKFMHNHKHIGLGMHHYKNKSPNHSIVRTGGDLGSLVHKMANLKVKAVKQIKPLKMRL